MFDSMKTHTPERLEELLRKYYDSIHLRATRRILKRNMYFGEDVELLAYVSTALIGVNDERAEFYARKALQLFNEEKIPTLWILPKLSHLSESDLEKFVPFLDKLLPSKEQYGRRPPTTQEKKYIKDMLSNSFSKSFSPYILGRIRKGREKLKFVANNDYQGSNINVLVEFSNVYHSSHSLEFDLWDKEYNVDISESKWQDSQSKLNDIEILKDKAIAYAERAINTSPKDYSLLRKLDCVFSTTDANPTSIYRRKVEELLDFPKEVLKILDFVFKYRSTEYYGEQKWALDMLLEKDPSNLEYLRRAAKLEFECCQGKNNFFRPEYKERAKKFYKKIYEQTHDSSEVPKEFWRDIGISWWPRTEQRTTSKDEDYNDFDFGGFGSRREQHRTYNRQEPFSGSRRERQREYTNHRTNNFDAAFIVVGIPSTATYEEAHLAYRKRSIKFHPDRNKDDKIAEKRMQEINEAWTDLKKNYYNK